MIIIIVHQLMEVEFIIDITLVYRSLLAKFLEPIFRTHMNVATEKLRNRLETLKMKLEGL